MPQAVQQAKSARLGAGSGHSRKGKVEMLQSQSRATEVDPFVDAVSLDVCQRKQEKGKFIGYEGVERRLICNPGLWTMTSD